MQLAKSEQASEKVVNFLNSQTDPTDDLLSVLPHRSGSGGQVAPVREVGFGLRVDIEHSAKRWGDVKADLFSLTSAKYIVYR